MTMSVRSALQLVLDQVDYTRGACKVTEMVGAVLPKQVISLARQALAAEAEPSEPPPAPVSRKKAKPE